MITGDQIATRTLTTRSGRLVTVTLIQPSTASSNVVEIVQTSQKWLKTARTYKYDAAVPVKVPFHARFAGDALWAIGRRLATGDRNILIAVTTDGEIVGAIDWHYLGSYEAHIDLATVSPRNQPEAPDGDKIRGIGSTLLNTAMGLIRKHDVPKVTLRPLDTHAEEFWRTHGFAVSNGLMGAPVALVASPDEDDVLVAAGDTAKLVPSFIKLKEEELPVVGTVKYKVMPGLERIGGGGMSMKGERGIPPVISKKEWLRGKDLSWILAHEIAHMSINELVRSASLYRPDLFVSGDPQTNLARYYILSGVDVTQIPFREGRVYKHGAEVAERIKANQLRPEDYEIASELAAEIVAYYITTWNQAGCYNLPPSVAATIMQGLQA